MIHLERQTKIRRLFRATRKLDVPNLVSHITQRAAGKELLFIEDKDYLRMLGLLKDISGKYALNVYAHCLMPNHMHLLLSPTKKNLYDAMRDLFARYAALFNRKYERKGHLFGGPYRQAVCLDDNYLLVASVYIHLNPVRAGIVRRPAEYRWTSYRLYSRSNAPKSFVDPEFILGMISPRSSESREIYRRLLKKAQALEVAEVLEAGDTIERFRENLRSFFPWLFDKVGRKRHLTRILGVDLLDEDSLDARIEAMKMDELYGKPESRRAKKYLIEQLIARGYSRSEIAKRLEISRKTVYNILK